MKAESTVPVDVRLARAAAILFDLDGVLVDSSLVVHCAWHRWARERDLPVSEVLGLVHGRPAREIVQIVAPHLDSEQQARCVARYEQECLSPLRALPGAQACVSVAERTRWAVVTSCGKALATKRLVAADLPVPTVLISADDVEMGKPDPEPYKRAARELAVDVGECLVVEDSPTGILAGVRAGMTVLAVSTTHPARSLRQADRVLGDMHEVARQLGTSVRDLDDAPSLER